MLLASSDRHVFYSPKGLQDCLNAKRCSCALYTAFDDFLKDGPQSEVKAFVVKEVAADGSIDDNDVDAVGLDGKHTTLWRDFWGFRLADNMYVRDGGRYFKLTVNKYYCARYRAVTKNDGMAAGMLFGAGIGTAVGAGSGSTETTCYLLDMRTGDFVEVDENLAEDILKEDKELYKEFKADGERRDKLMNYLKRYFKEHREPE